MPRPPVSRETLGLYWATVALSLINMVAFRNAQPWMGWALLVLTIANAAIHTHRYFRAKRA